MKRLIKLLLILSIISQTIAYKTVFAQEDIVTLTQKMGYTFNPNDKPKSSIVIDANNGDILWADNIDLKRDPASTTKIMTLLLLYEDIEQGKLSMDTKITATKSDEAIGKLYEISNNYKIFAGVEYPIKELIPMVLVPSSNVATVMIANYLSNNDIDGFIDRMNIRAKELGMHNTTFNNATGAVARAFAGYYSPSRYDNFKGNETTARDLSILAYHFLKKYDSILQFTKDTTIKTMVGTPYEEEFKSYNHSLKGGRYELKGTDGLKTGSSTPAGFNIIMTTKRNDFRVITVVLGVGNWSDQNGEYYRHPFTNAITEYAFSNYDYIKAFDIGTNTLGEVSFEVDKPIYITTKKGEDPTVTIFNNELTINNELNTVTDSLNKTFPIKINYQNTVKQTSLFDNTIYLIGILILINIFLLLFLQIKKHK